MREKMSQKERVKLKTFAFGESRVWKFIKYTRISIILVSSLNDTQILSDVTKSIFHENIWKERKLEIKKNNLNV